VLVPGNFATVQASSAALRPGNAAASFAGAVRLLEKGAGLYDVGKLLGISAQTVERHCAPYCRELQQRGTDLINSLD
jgi:hypothetical protein